MSRRNRNRQPAPEAVEIGSLPPEAEAPKVEPLFLDDHLTPARCSTHAEIVLREAVEREFRRVHQMLREFVEGELARGATIEQVLDSYELVTCLVPTVTWDGDRPRVKMTAEIVEKAGEGEGDE